MMRVFFSEAVDVVGMKDKVNRHTKSIKTENLFYYIIKYRNQQNMDPII